MSRRSAIRLRVATRADRGAIEAMQALSMRRLGRTFYAADVIEAFIALGTLDPALLDGGTLFVAVTDDGIVGSGGWSGGRPSCEVGRVSRSGGRVEDGAAVCSLFVHPDVHRQGVGRRLMNAIEPEIAAAGFDAAHLTATLPAIPFYRRLGWQSGAPAVLALTGGLQMVGLDMWKPLGLAVRPSGPARWSADHGSVAGLTGL